MITRTIIPALPGFDLLELASHDNFSATPIVGWLVVDPNGHSESTEAVGAFPICAGWGDNEITPRNKIVRDPRGTITFLDSLMTFKKGDEDEALQYAAMRGKLREETFAC